MRRTWKILKRTGISLVTLTAALLTVAAILNWRANSRLEKLLAAIRTAGDPVTLAELASDPVPAEQNAMTHLRSVEVQVAAINKSLNEVLDLQGPFWQGGKLNAEEAAKVRAVFQAHPQVFSALDSAMNCRAYVPRYAFADVNASIATSGRKTLLDSVLDRAGPSRLAARVRTLRSDLEVFDGKPDEALKVLVQSLRYSGHLEHEPFIVSFL